GQGEVEHEASELPVLRDVAESTVEDRRRCGSGDVAARDADAAGGRLAETGDRVDQLRLPVPVNARDADDLTTANLERDATDRFEPTVVEDVEIVDGQQRVPRVRDGLLDSEEDLPADHHPSQALLGCSLAVDGVDSLSTPDDRDSVGDLEYLVQLVRDEDE